MSKYSYLLKKWWFWALAILFLVILFYSFWVIIYLVALASLIFGIVKVVKNENRRKYTIILTISAIFLITFSLIRVVQMYNYVINNPEETTANEQKKNTVQDEQTEKPAQEDAAEDEQA
ncbi:hypothetical protein DKH36_14860, partial [Listeria monocytogenes]|nr:hypothetical protein [Listeria monocytogenes]